MARTAVNRRQFLASSSLLALGAGRVGARQAAAQTPTQGANLRTEPTPAEAELVNRSAMAKDLDAVYPGKGYSCAESGLLVGLRFLKKPEEQVWAAAGFGGGLGQRDLCGFLTAGVMTIGVWSGSLGMDPAAARKLCAQKRQEYWDWWRSTAPLHCAEIRAGNPDPGVCHRLGKLAAAELERLMGPPSGPA